MSALMLEKKLANQQKNHLKGLKKYRIKISMIKPYYFIDFWAKKPKLNNALEVFLHELSVIDPGEYFKVEVSQS